MGARIVVSLYDQIVGEFELGNPVTVVGRRPDCDVVLEHAAISGRHALIRRVDTTWVVEDLASTNGVRVNGVACERELLHHLDVLELGEHRIHFFDDRLLAGRVGSLESTVHAGFDEETTYQAPGLDDAAGPSRDPLPAALAVTQPTGAGSAVAAAAAAAAARLRVADGPRAGESMPLVETHTLVGAAGGDNALVVRRGRSYYLARFAGSPAPRLNGREIGPGTHAIAEGDTIEVGAQRYQLILQPEAR